MSGDPNVDAIISAALSQIEGAIRSAYETGRQEGIKVGLSQAMQRVQAALNVGSDEVQSTPLQAIQTPLQQEGAAPKPTGVRVARGAVKPLLLDALKGKSSGLFIQDIAKATGLKETTTRSKLSELRQAGLVDKFMGRFLLAEFTKPQAPMPSQDDAPVDHPFHLDTNWDGQ